MVTFSSLPVLFTLTEDEAVTGASVSSSAGSSSNPGDGKPEIKQEAFRVRIPVRATFLFSVAVFK